MRLVIKVMVAVLVLSASAHVAHWMTTGIKHCMERAQQHNAEIADVR